MPTSGLYDLTDRLLLDRSAQQIRAFQVGSPTKLYVRNACAASLRPAEIVANRPREMPAVG